MILICFVLQAYFYVLIARIILSWFPISSGGALAGVYDFLRRLTDPILEPLRRVIPPVRFGGAAIDFSPIVVFFGLLIVRGLLGC
jgi:YggT family protein